MTDSDLWDQAHLDYTSDHPRPSPAGLAETDADWRHELYATANGHLLRTNTLTAALTSGKPVHLMHTTVALDAIRASGQLFASTGCLMAALYCAPLTLEPAGLRPHNLGAYLLETKPYTSTLVLTVTPSAPTPSLGIDYLRTGPIHLKTYLEHRGAFTQAEDAHLRHAVTASLRTTASFLNTLFANAAGHRTPAVEFINRLATAVVSVPVLGYLYFEVLSEYLMLHSTSPQTRALAEVGEMNNRLYKLLAFRAAADMGQLFDLARFAPDHNQMRSVIDTIEPGLSGGAAEYTRRRLSHLAACLALAPGLTAASTVIEAKSDFDVLARTVPGLVGQLVFRHTRLMPRYPHLYLLLEQAKALSIWQYWNNRGIATPFNSMPKGEIGLNTAFPDAQCRIWIADRCERGLLHPREELDVAPVPRLADLSLTAMRRDKNGQASGHPHG